MRTNRLPRWGLLALASVMLTGASASGCRVDEDDIQRWETTQHGPEKLVAVITHDKYEPEMRVEAAIALIRMKPRGGRRVGIPLMVDAVATLTTDMRKTVVGGMLTTLVTEIGKPPPVAQAGQLPPDDSIPFKDAAFALLSYNKDKRVLVTEEEHRQALIAALSIWCASDFEHRYDNASQLFGIEQVIKYIGAPAAKLLPKLITNESRKIPELAKIIAASGDHETKEEASKRVVAVAEHTASEAWINALKPTVEEANRIAKLKPNPAQFAAQLTAAQDEQLKRMFGAMRQIGGRATVEFCLTFASNKDNDADRRALALAAVEGNFDQKNPNDVARILDLAASQDAPDKIRDLAFRRVGEMPRDRVINKLYEIFASKRWQVRWVAAQYAIRMSDTSQIPEIFSHFPKIRDDFAMTEALSYGDWMGSPDRMAEKDGKTARAQLEPYFRDPSVPIRISALGWFYGHGTKSDVEYLKQHAEDRSAVPRCTEEQTNCEWKCYIDKEGGKPGEKEPKDVTNVGEFVRYCIISNIKDRTEDPARKKKDEPDKK